MSDSDTDAAVVAAIERWQIAVAAAEGYTLPPLQTMQALGHTTDKATLRLIGSLVHAIRPRHVIEFGCGPATELLALLGFEDGRMAVTTFEHDPWAAQELMLHANPFAINYRWFSFCICPWIVRRCGSATQPVFDDGMTTSTVPYPADLIVIKPVSLLLGGRGGLLFQALKYARTGTIVLLESMDGDEPALVNFSTSDLSGHVVDAPRYDQPHVALVVRSPFQEPFRLERPREQERA
jgi:hypothetical protein